MTDTSTPTPKRPDAMTIAIWIFVVVEAIGIAWFIWHTLQTKK